MGIFSHRFSPAPRFNSQEVPDSIARDLSSPAYGLPFLWSPVALREESKAHAHEDGESGYFRLHSVMVPGCFKGGRSGRESLTNFSAGDLKPMLSADRFEPANFSRQSQRLWRHPGLCAEFLRQFARTFLSPKDEEGEVGLSIEP